MKWIRQERVTIPTRVEHVRGIEGPADLNSEVCRAEFDAESLVFTADAGAFGTCVDTMLLDFGTLVITSGYNAKVITRL